MFPPAAAPLGPAFAKLPPPEGATRRLRDPWAHQPSILFLTVVSVLALAADIGSKLWAEKRLDDYKIVEVLPNHLQFLLAKNKGGAWGLLQGTSENVRRPFFLLVSAAAIAFIVTLYRRLQPRQRALKWGLPLVLGGALGNVFDRIRYGHVIDFIDYRAEWVRKMNDLFVRGKVAPVSTDHWPTFNVADIAICVGVALMAIDMFTTRRPSFGVHLRSLPPPAPSVLPPAPSMLPPDPGPVPAAMPGPAPPPRDGDAT